MTAVSALSSASDPLSLSLPGATPAERIAVARLAKKCARATAHAQGSVVLAGWSAAASRSRCFGVALLETHLCQRVARRWSNPFHTVSRKTSAMGPVTSRAPH